MTYVNPITPVSSRHGAPMGRHLGPGCLYTSERLYLRRVRLNSGGYDAGGAYWGHGAPLWHVQDCDGNGRIFRAASRDAAKAHVREDYPDARCCPWFSVPNVRHVARRSDSCVSL